MILMYIKYKKQISSIDFEDLASFLLVSDTTIFRDIKILIKNDLVLTKNSLFDNTHKYILSQKSILILDEIQSKIMIQ